MAGDISEPEEEEGGGGGGGGSGSSSASLELDRAVPRHTLLGTTNNSPLYQCCGSGYVVYGSGSRSFSSIRIRIQIPVKKYKKCSNP